MKKWISKHWATKGIYEAEGEFQGIYFCTGRNGFTWVDKSECHDTREQAVAAAEAARTKKLASLRKQIAKIEAINFSEKGEG